MTLDDMEGVRAVLRLARGLVWKGWCQGVSARDANNEPVLSHSKEAERWCASGAITCSSRFFAKEPSLYADVREEAMHYFQRQGLPAGDMCQSITRWNDQDYRTHLDVLDAFDRAIYQINADIAEKEASL